MIGFPAGKVTSKKLSLKMSCEKSLNFFLLKIFIITKLNLTLLRPAFIMIVGVRLFGSSGVVHWRCLCHRNQSINGKGTYILADVLAMDNSTVDAATKLFCGFSLK
jgi:hypothetical protein